MERHPSELKCVFLFSCRWEAATHTNRAKTTWLDDWLQGKQPLYCAIKAQQSFRLWGNADSRGQTRRVNIFLTLTSQFSGASSQTPHFANESQV